MLTIENTDSDLKVHELHYAYELIIRVRLSFQKLLQTHQTSRNNKKQVLAMINHCLRNLQINSDTRVGSFLAMFLSQNKRKNIRVSLQLAWGDLIIHSQREIEVLFSTLKNPPFPLAQSVKLHISALVRIPCLIPWHRCEKYARESLNSHHLITQRDNIHARTPEMCVDPRGYMTSGWRNLF